MKRSLFIAGLAVCLLFSGCLDFSGQDIFLARSKNGRDLYALIVYHGIHSGGEVEKDCAQLRSRIDGGDAFAPLANWPFEFTKSGIIEGLSASPESFPARARLAERFKKHFFVHYGGFYLDKQTKLPGFWQLICITKVKDFVREGNHAINEDLSQESPNFEQAYPKTAGLWCRGKHEWFNFNGSALELHFPVHPDEFPRIRSQETVKIFNEDEDNFWKIISSRNIVSLIQDTQSATFRLGDPDVRSNSIHYLQDDECTTNLLTTLQQEPLWRGELNVKDMIGAFQGDPDRFVKDMNFRDEPETKGP